MAGKANEGGEENKNARGVESSPLEKAKQIAATMCRQHKEAHWLGVRMENFLRAYQQKLEGVAVTGGLTPSSYHTFLLTHRSPIRFWTIRLSPIRLSKQLSAISVANR